MSTHKPFLLQEVIRELDLKPGEIFVDATYGGGGHSEAVAERYPGIRIIAIDQDPLVEPSFEIRNSKFEFTRGNFRNLDKLLKGTRVDAILFDLGFSSDQLVGKGLSFMKDEPLDMRLSGQGLTAADILNTWKEGTIELILRGFGEERASKKIAHAIASRRDTQPFETTFDLVRVIGGRRGRIHPATKVFQALRIAVNEELDNLERGLEKAFELLRPGGRLVVISFHSLEDRIVKRFAREKEEKGKPIMPSEEEISMNPRARSAKLRIIKKNV